MKHYLLLLLIVSSLLGESLESAAKSFSEQCAALAGEKPVRIGILPLTPNQDIYKESNPFGEYAAEQLENALVARSGKIRLYERKKLNDVAQELALNQSEMIDAEQAIELGGMVPVDYIVNGSYTKTGSEIALSLRVLDVVTGEIVLAEGREVSLSKGMGNLFETATVNSPKESQNIVITLDTAQSGPVLPGCETEQWPLLKEALGDLTSEEKVEAVVAIAEKIPFDTTCEHLHGRVLNQFQRYKIFSDRYAVYLRDELQRVENPDKYNELYTLQHYLLQNTLGTQEEWEIWLALSANRKYTKSTLRQLMITDTLVQSDLKKLSSRVSEVAALVKSGSVGKPVVLTVPEGFSLLSDITRATSVEYRKGAEHMAVKNALVLEMCNATSPQEWSRDLNDRNAQNYYEVLLKGIIRSTYGDGADLDQFLPRVSQFLTTVELNETGARLSVELLWSLYQARFNSRYTQVQKELFEKAYTSSFDSFRPRFAEAALLITNEYMKNRVMVLSLLHDIDVEGYPTVVELSGKLSGNSSEKELAQAAYLLAQIGTIAKPAESRVVRIYRRVPRLLLERPHQIKLNLLTVLKNVVPEDSASVALLVGALNQTVPASDSTMSSSRISTMREEAREIRDYALEAFSNGNSKTVSHLKELFETGDTATKRDAIMALGMVENEKKSVVSLLNKWYDSVSEIELQDAIDDALDRVEFQ